MRMSRYFKASKILTAFILFTLCFGILDFVIFATNKTVLRVVELFDRKRVLNEEALRHVQSYDVILSAYMNSGSTYTGKILGFRKDAFYFYEPLWRLTLWGYYKSNFTVCSTRTSTCREVSKDDINKNKPIVGRSNKGTLDFTLLHDDDIINKTITPVQIAQRIIRHVFQCCLLQVRNLIQPEVTENAKFSGPSWNIYRYCLLRNKPFEYCLELLQSSNCQEAKHKISKVLRLSLGALGNLLRDIPRLKGIHLFRDPRAVIHSRLETHGYPLERTKIHSGIKNNAKALCNKMASDLEEGKRLKKMFPNRFRFIHYEDIYTRDYALIELHTFLGMTINNDIIYNARARVSNRGSRRDLSARSERIRNNAFWWRRYLSWDIVKLVDAECSFLYSELGYPFIFDEHSLQYYNDTLLVHNLKFSFT
ncbi:carbohydrate sulfotransferase 1-like [Mercenaria mercenaria]|uniref:carbohydrate sulfotransferase 1-like n=1 Tax=Mercenaria mercenaria TaxID=6596 RepID=UPI00234E8EB1|nr:carbohydrate sulfotransferase 1-like [Mercenaria mercenaria]